MIWRAFLLVTALLGAGALATESNAPVGADLAADAPATPEK